MIGWLLERLFVDRKGRESRARLRRAIRKPDSRKAGGRGPGAAPGTEPHALAQDAAGAATDRTEREKLIDDTMSIFRQRRTEYEKLDDAVRDRIDKAANEALGDGRK